MINVADNFKGNINEIRFYSFSTSREFSFKAFLTDFSDEYRTNWNNTEIYGRMDPIYTYKNTVRTISLGFDVPNFDVAESIKNSRNADTLIRSLYPVYEINSGLGTSVLSSPPLFKIKFANLITNVAYTEDSNADITAENGGLMGWIDGYAFKPELDSGFFIENNKLYAKLFKVSFKFNVIHEHPLGVGLESGVKEARPSFNLFSHNYSDVLSNIEFDTTPSSNTTPQTPQQENLKNVTEQIPVGPAADKYKNPADNYFKPSGFGFEE